MALWDNIGSRGSVEDRRGMAPAAGIGIAGVILILAFSFLSGGNIPVEDVLNQLLLQTPAQQNSNIQEFEGEDDYEVFASTVLGSTNDVWTEIFNIQNRRYIPPKLILFRQATQSECGIATSAVGPHYCPADNHIYLDETFFDELTRELGAQGGDVAEAYVIAHEVGHHVQNQLGVFDQIGNSQQDGINVELQADCFAGLWMHSLKDQNVLEIGEIREAMDAAEAVGDDRIQEKTEGQVNAETWTHGSSEQRLEWFTRGYESGEFAQCNTF